MKRKLSYILAILVTVAGLGCFASSQVADNKFSAVPTAPPAQTKPVTETPAEVKPATETHSATPVKIHLVNPLMVVKAPAMFLNLIDLMNLPGSVPAAQPWLQGPS